MRTTTMMAILAAGTVMAAQAEVHERTITVYVVEGSTVPFRISYPARALASRMFAEAGIQIDWRLGKLMSGGSGRPIEIVYDTNRPEDFKRGALAYALPFEGTHIHVFYDRIARTGESDPTRLLAHVLVHEITHILQGVARHSTEGIMKAHWSCRDIAGMRQKPLPFTPDDLKLIHEGMDRRATGPVLAARVDSAAILTQ